MNNITRAFGQVASFVDEAATTIKEKSVDFVQQRIGVKAVAGGEQAQAIVAVQPLPTADLPEDDRGDYVLVGRMSILIGHPDLINLREYESICAEAKERKFLEKSYFRGQFEKFNGTFKRIMEVKLAVQEQAFFTHAALESPPDDTSDE